MRTIGANATPRVACWYARQGEGMAPSTHGRCVQSPRRLRSMAIARAARHARRRVRPARWLGPWLLAAAVFGSQLAVPVTSSAAVAPAHPRAVAALAADPTPTPPPDP